MPNLAKEATFGKQQQISMESSSLSRKTLFLAPYARPGRGLAFDEGIVRIREALAARSSP